MAQRRQRKYQRNMDTSRRRVGFEPCDLEQSAMFLPIREQFQTSTKLASTTGLAKSPTPNRNVSPTNSVGKFERSIKKGIHDVARAKMQSDFARLKNKAHQRKMYLDKMYAYEAKLDERKHRDIRGAARGALATRMRGHQPWANSD